MREFVNRKSHREIYESMLIALFINVPAINIIIASVVPSLSNGVMAIIYLLLFCLFLFEFIIYYLKRARIEKITSFVIIFTVIIFYVLTWMMIGNQLSIYNLVIYVFLPLLVISKMDINGEEVIKLCTLIPLIGIPFFPMVFQQVNNSISMGLSYAFLPAVIFASCYLLIYSKNSKLFTAFAIIDLTYFVLIFLHGSRGVVLSSFLAIFLFWLIRKKIKNEYDPYFTLKIICIIILFIILVFFGWDILNYMYNFFINKGITVEFLDKIIRLQKLGGIDNGRNEISKIFFSEFFKRPLFGYGIKSFEYYTGIIYPHNFLYQMLFDMGGVGTLIIMAPLLVSIIKIISKIGCYENASLLIALICSSVPGALFSGDLWLNSLLWLTFSLILRREYRL